jgi:hypothetical protein
MLEGRLAVEQRAGRCGDQDQVGRSEEGGGVQRLGQQLAIHEAVVAPGHVAHPGAADDGQVGVDHRAAATAQEPQKRLVKDPADREQQERGDVQGAELNHLRSGW